MSQPGQQPQGGNKRPVFTFGGLSNSAHETKTPVDRCWLCHNVNTDNGILEGIKRPLSIAQIGDGTLFTFTVTSANATAGATYTNNGQTFTITVNAVGVITLRSQGTGAPSSSGTLTKTSGTGDSTINFSAFVAGVTEATVIGAGYAKGSVDDIQKLVMTPGCPPAQYTFTCTSANATIGATYTNNGHTYTVLTTIVSGTTLKCSGTGAPSASGTLTKAAGSGDATITYSSVTTTLATFRLTFDGDITPGLIAYNAPEGDIQSALIATASINAGDATVTGGPINVAPVYVKLGGQYRNAPQTLMTVTNTAMPTGYTVTASHWIIGGSYEYYFVMAVVNSETTARLYTVTSNDGFVANFTWASIGSGFDNSPWFFQQYLDSVYAVNQTDGQIVYPLGGTLQTRIGVPDQPQTKMVIAVQTQTQSSSGSHVTWSGSSYANSGFSSPPTITDNDTSLSITFNADQVASVVTVTITLPAVQNYQYNDAWTLRMANSNLAEGLFNGAGFSLVDNGSVPVTTLPPYDAYDYAFQTRTGAWGGDYQFVDTNRVNRENTIQIILSINVASIKSGTQLYIGLAHFDNWLNDTLALPFFTSPTTDLTPTQATIQYAYSYYNVSTQQEGLLSDQFKSGNCPPTGITGCKNLLTVPGDYQLQTTDLIYFYRQEKSTGIWRRLPNADGTYGVGNVTSGTASFTDHNMEHELANYPTGLSVQPDLPGVIGAWKGSLVIGAERQIWMSEVGAPNQFAPSPDSNVTNAAELLLQGPGRGVTMYPSTDRSEQIYNISGQDALYVATDKNVYATLADQPSDIIAMRAIKSSRGSLGFNAACAYNGSLILATQWGAWLYRVSRMWADLDGGNDQATELSAEFRRSWARFIAPAFTITFNTGITSGTFTITWKGQTTNPIPWNATAKQIKTALELLPNMNIGDVDVYINGVLPGGSPNTNGIGTTDGTVYLRFAQQWGGVSAVRTDLACDTSSLLPGQYTFAVSSANATIGATYTNNAQTFTVLSTVAGGMFISCSGTGAPLSSGTLTKTSGTGDSTIAFSSETTSLATIAILSKGGTANVFATQYKEEFWFFNDQAFLTKTISDKWIEGTLNNPPQAVVPSIANGLIFFSGNSMFRIADGYTDQTRWIYETGVNASNRQRVLRLYTIVKGTPTFKVIKDDMAGGEVEECYQLSANKNFLLDFKVLPGVMHTFQFAGANDTDKFIDCQMVIEDAGEGAGA